MGLTVAIVGGDRRMLYAARSLAARGYGVRFFSPDGAISEAGFGDVPLASLGECLGGAGAVVLPLPASRDGGTVWCPLVSASPTVGEVFSLIPDGALVFAGKVTRCVADAARERGIGVIDYYADEGFLIKNAALTAEGALAVILTELPRSLAGSKAAVFGYGRCASALVRRLIMLGADVSVIARSAVRRAQAQADGARAYAPSEAAGALAGADFAVNTVPAPVIGHAEAANLAGAPVIELADVSGVADGVKVNVIRAAGLPGRFSPETAGVMLAESIQGVSPLGRHSGTF